MGLIAATGMGWFLQVFTQQFQIIIPS
jgi:hypothetical protein